MNPKIIKNIYIKVQQSHKMKFRTLFLMFFEIFEQTDEKYFRQNEITNNDSSQIFCYKNNSLKNDNETQISFGGNPGLYTTGNYNTGSLACFNPIYPPHHVETPNESSRTSLLTEYKSSNEDNNENLPKIISIAYQLMNINSVIQPDQLQNDEPRFSIYQECDLFQPKTSNFSSFSNNKYIESANETHFDNISFNSTDQAPPFNPSIEKTITDFCYKQIIDSICNQKYNVWNTYGVKELNNYDWRLLKNFKKFNEIENWNKLDKNCEMFQKDIREHIEFHYSEVFKNITIFRRKIYKKRENYTHDYLFIKGDPKKYLKNLYWRGSKIFIMDCSGIGNGVGLSGNTYIGPNSRIGDNTFIHNHVFLKEDVEIQKETFIGYQNFFGKGCKIGILNQENNVSEVSGFFPEKTCPIDMKNHKEKKFKTKIGCNNYFPDNSKFSYGIYIGDGNVFR